jgi:hypothetical protein
MARIRVVVAGHERYRKLAQDLRETKNGPMQKELYRGLYQATFKLQAAAIEGASRLPKTGGRDAAKYRLQKTGTKTINGETYVTRARVRVKSSRPAESLAARVAQAKYSVRGTGSRQPKIKLIARAKSGRPVDLRRLDEGFVRHPVFATGGRGTWRWAKADQPVAKGWFSDPVQEHSGEVRKALVVAVDKVIADLKSKGSS